MVDIELRCEVGGSCVDVELVVSGIVVDMRGVAVDGLDLDELCVCE